MIYGVIPEPHILASGTGKTLSMVRFVSEMLAHDTRYNIQREVLSNIHLTFTPYTPIERNDFTDTNVKKRDFTKKIIVIDEIQEFIDSRTGKGNLRILNNIVHQQRHQENDIFYTGQHMDMADKRLRRSTGYFIYCAPVQFAQIAHKRCATHFKVTIYSRIANGVIAVYTFDGRPYYALYNSYELIERSSK